MEQALKDRGPEQEEAKDLAAGKAKIHRTRAGQPAAEAVVKAAVVAVDGVKDREAVKVVASHNWCPSRMDTDERTHFVRICPSF